jgi:hypothetical protein
MKVSRKWIQWAHEPPAESGVGLSERLCQLAEAPGRGRIEITDPALLAELLDVAECYGSDSATEDMGPWWIGEQRRVVREARKELRCIANREADATAGGMAQRMINELASRMSRKTGGAA